MLSPGGKNDGELKDDGFSKKHNSPSHDFLLAMCWMTWWALYIIVYYPIPDFRGNSAP